MPRNQKTNGSAASLPNVGTVLQVQIDAAENATRMAGATFNHVISMNRAWLNLWNNRIAQFSELPRRLADAQIDFMAEALDDYQESMQQLGALALQAKNETENTTREAAGTMERAAQQPVPQPREAPRTRRVGRVDKGTSGERRGSERRPRAH